MKNLIGILSILITITLLFSCGVHTERGPQGQPGVAGPAGADGSSCTVTKLSDASLIQCSNGSSALVSDGATGPTGATGLTGPAGTPGTQIQMVQLCPQFTGSYPTLFPEYVYLIDNKFFGVMSSGGLAWTAQLYPGSYTTTNTGSNCNFTVNANSTISH